MYTLPTLTRLFVGWRMEERTLSPCLEEADSPRPRPSSSSFSHFSTNTTQSQDTSQAQAQSQSQDSSQAQAHDTAQAHDGNNSGYARKTKLHSLLRLFESQFFNSSMAIMYLYKYQDHDVQEYLCYRIQVHELKELYLFSFFFIFFCCYWC